MFKKRKGTHKRTNGRVNKKKMGVNSNFIFGHSHEGHSLLLHSS